MTMNHFGLYRISNTRIERHHIIVKVENVGPRPERERERLRYKENVYYKYLPFWFGLNVCVYAFEILMTSNKHVCVCRWISPIDNVQVCSSDVSIFPLEFPCVSLFIFRLADPRKMLIYFCSVSRILLLSINTQFSTTNIAAALCTIACL